MKKWKAALAILGALIVVCAAFALYLWFKNPDPVRPAAIDNPTGFVQAQGANIYDGDGKLLQLRGVNLGNWLVQENYMSVTDVGDFDTGVFTEARALAAMKANPNLTDAQIEELYHIRAQAYMTEEDFARIAGLGLNCVRLNFGWWTFTTDGETPREDAFRYVDWALDMCDKYELYAVLDNHGAMGSQNQDQHSGDDSQFHLYDGEENRRMTVDLWKLLAERYRDRTCVAGYDLLNECRRAPGRYGGRINTDFYDELYRAVRSVDPNHMIFIGYFTFPIHGGRVSHYNWENVCLTYHIYNRTPFSQITCLNFIKALHNFMGSDMPVYIGEFNAWTEEQDWLDTLDWFDAQGWSWSSWAYKTNSWSYLSGENSEWSRDARMRNWGVYELYMEPVDLSTATFEEIRTAYLQSATENAKPSLVHEVYNERLAQTAPN